MKTHVLFVSLALCCLLLCACAIGGPKPSAVEIAPTPEATGLATPTASPQAEETPAPGGEYWVLFLNVGRADSALICANKQYWLVDTGEKDGAEALIDKLNALGVTGLEGIFLTHTHSDHTGGAKKIAAAIPVSKFYRASITTLTEKGKDKLSDIAADVGAPETRLNAGDALELNGAKVTVLGPVVYNAQDDNDNSLVFRLEANGHTVLFTGDMQFAEEQTLMNIDLTCDVLKVGNHGNPDATGEAFAAAASPDIAVISTNTAQDTDSANERVKAALSDALIYTTENFTVGVKVDLSGDAIAVSDPGFDPAKQAQGLYSSFAGQLVNRAHTLAADYVPESLADIAGYDIPALTLKADGMRGNAQAVGALRAMLTAAQEAGESGFYLVSAYRTYEEQQALWDKKIAANASYGSDPATAIVTAYPGASEHQTGLAFDISAVDARALSPNFAQTPQGKWLYANSWRFGFILRYPADELSQSETGIVFEPWHFRYVGKALAAYLFRTGVTLERFYAEFLPQAAG